MDQYMRKTGKFPSLGQGSQLTNDMANPFDVAKGRDEESHAEITNQDSSEQKASLNKLHMVQKETSSSIGIIVDKEVDANIKMFNSVRGIQSYEKISPQLGEDISDSQQSFKVGKQSISRSSSNFTMQDKFFDQDNNPKPRRSSIDKRRKPVTKRRKYIDLHEEYLQVRYVLFYADDIVQDALTAKKLVQNQYMIGDPAHKKLSETFKQRLRENQGIYFDINISPRKRANSSMMLPFANLEVDGQTSEDFPDQTVFGPSYSQKMEQLSPTFKMIGANNVNLSVPINEQLSSAIGSNVGSFKLKQLPLTSHASFNPATQFQSSPLSKTSNELLQQKEIRLDAMLLSPKDIENAPTPQMSNMVSNSKFSNDSIVDHQEIDKDQIIAYEMHNDSVQNIDQFLDEQSKMSRAWQDETKELINAESKNTLKSEKDIDAGKSLKSTGSDQYAKMRDMSSFIHKNYDSPNIKDIKKVVRRREIDEIDLKQEKKKQMRDKLGASPTKDESMSPANIRKGSTTNIGESSIYKKRKELMLPKGSTKTLYEGYENLQIISIKADKPELQTNREDASHDKNLEKILEDDESAKATQENVEQKEFFDDIHKFIPQEPKSGMPKVEKHVRKKSAQCPQYGRSGLKKKKSNSSISVDETEINSLQSESGTNSDDENPGALQLMRMKSQILNERQIIGGKKLRRQTFMMNQNNGFEINKLDDETELLLQSSLVPESENLQRQKSAMNTQLKQRLQKKDAKNSSGINVINQPLKLMKMETAQPSKQGALDTYNQHSRNQKTSHRIDKDSTIKSKITGEKSQVPQFSSNLPQHSEQERQNKRRKRRKDIKQLQKFKPMTLEDKEMEEEKQYIKMQFKHFKYFKNMAQIIQNKTIKCQWEDSQNSIAEMYKENTGTNNDDTTQGDQTNTHNPYFYDGNLKMHKSIQSRENSSSTPNPNCAKDFSQQIQSYSQLDPRSSNISNEQIPRVKKDLNKKKSNLDSDFLEQTEKKSRDESRSENKRKRQLSKSKTDDLSIQGYNHQVKYSLNVPNNLDFCQKSKSYSSNLVKSSQNSRRDSSMLSSASDFKSQRSRNADELQRLRSQVSLTKKLPKKHSRLNIVYDSNNKTQMSKFADQYHLDQLKSQSKLNQEKAQAHNFFLNVINIPKEENKSQQYSNNLKERNPTVQAQRQQLEENQNTITYKNNHYNSKSNSKEVNSAGSKNKYQNLKILTRSFQEEAKSSPSNTVSSGNDYSKNRQRSSDKLRMPQVNNQRQHDIEQVAQQNGSQNIRSSNNQQRTLNQQNEEGKRSDFSNSKIQHQIQLKVCDQRMDVDDERDSNRKQKAQHNQYQLQTSPKNDSSQYDEESKHLDMVGELNRDSYATHQYIYDADPNIDRRYSLRDVQSAAQISSNFSKLKKAETNEQMIYNSQQSPEFYQRIRKHDSRETQQNTKESDNMTFADVRSRNFADNQIGNQSEFSFVVSPTNLNKLHMNQESAMNISLGKADSLKKSESPTHLMRINEHESQHSLSKISRSSLNKLNSSIAEYNISGERSNEKIRPRNTMNHHRGTVSQGSSNKSSQFAKQKGGLSFNLKTCLRELDNDIQKKYPGDDINQLKPIIEQSVFSAISQKSTSSLGKLSNKKGKQLNADGSKDLQMNKQISKYEREFHYNLSQKKKYNPRKSQEYEEFPQNFNGPQVKLKIQHSPPRGNNERERTLLSKSSNQESRYLALDQNRFSNEFDISLANREQKTAQRRKDQYIFNDQDGTRKIEIKVSKQQSRSNETLLIEKHIPQSAQKNRYSKSRRSSEYQDEIDHGSKPNLFEGDDQESIQHQSNIQKDIDLFNHQIQDFKKTAPRNRLSLQLGGYPIQNQMSHNPLSHKKREKSEEQTFTRTQKLNRSKPQNQEPRAQQLSGSGQKPKQKDIKSKVVNQCLDELQSIFTRHHGKVNEKMQQQHLKIDMKATANTILSPPHHGKSDRQISQDGHKKSTYGYQTTQNKQVKNNERQGASQSQYYGYNQQYVKPQTQKYQRGMLKQNYQDNESIDEKQNTSISNISQSDQIRMRKEKYGHLSPVNQHSQIIQPQQQQRYNHQINENFDKTSIYNGSVSHLNEKFDTGSAVDAPQYSEFSRLGDNTHPGIRTQFKTPAKVNSGAINSSTVLSPQTTQHKNDGPRMQMQLNKTQKYGDEYSKQFGYNNSVIQETALKKTQTYIQRKQNKVININQYEKKQTLQFNKPPNLLSQQISQTSPSYKAIEGGQQDDIQMDEFEEDGYDPFEEDGYDPFESKEPSMNQNDSFIGYDGPNQNPQPQFVPFMGYQDPNGTQVQHQSFQARNTMTRMAQGNIENNEFNQIQIKKEYTAQLSNTFTTTKNNRKEQIFQQAQVHPKIPKAVKKYKNMLQAPRGMREFYAAGEARAMENNTISMNEFDNDRQINQVFEQDKSNTANKRSNKKQDPAFEHDNKSAFTQQQMSRNNEAQDYQYYNTTSNIQNNEQLPYNRQSLESKQTKRGHFIENIIQQIHQPKEQMPVYYDNNAGPRYSIISETVQAQPYRPPVNDSQHHQPDDNPFGSAAIREESEFSQHFGTRPSGPMQEPSSANYTYNKFNKSGKSGISGETGNFQCSQGTQGLNQMIQNPSSYQQTPLWNQNVENLQQFEQEESENIQQNTNTPFGLKLLNQQISEPMHARYITKNRRDLTKDH